MIHPTFTELENLDNQVVHLWKIFKNIQCIHMDNLLFILLNLIVQY